MVRVLVRLPSPRPASIALEGERFHYVARVLRLGPGASLEVFDGEGAVLDATVEEVGADRAILRLGAERPAPRAPSVTVVQALAKGEKLEWILQKGTELGASAFRLVETARAVVKLEPKRAEERLGRWRRICEEAARQCGRAEVPEVSGPSPLAGAVRGLAPGTRVLALDEEERSMRLSSALADTPPLSPIALVVGPEGGLDRAEIASLRELGAVSVTLGARVLRTETASVAALAVLLHLRGELG